MGHAERLADEDWGKGCIMMNMEDSKPRGRPQKTWMEVLIKYMKEKVVSREGIPRIVIDGGVEYGKIGKLFQSWKKRSLNRICDACVCLLYLIFEP